MKKKMTKTTKPKKVEKEIEETIKEILEKLKVETEVEIVKETDDHYKVNIKTQETGLLIGRHGEIINGLQLFLGVVLYKKLGNWVHVVLDVGDYRKTREETIKEMVNRIVAEVETTLRPVALPYLTPLERRIVHLMLTDQPKVTSESIGEGKDRLITIKPR